jgi:hypothetical protein
MIAGFIMHSTIIRHFSLLMDSGILGVFSLINKDYLSVGVGKWRSNYYWTICASIFFIVLIIVIVWDLRS